MEVTSIAATELGRRLRLARERTGFTQARAAKEVDVARTTLAAMESGERRATIEELRALARCYGESVNMLVSADSMPADRRQAFEDYRQGLLSEGQLVQLLYLDRIEVRELLDELDSERDGD